MKDALKTLEDAKGTEGMTDTGHYNANAWKVAWNPEVLDELFTIECACALCADWDPTP